MNAPYSLVMVERFCLAMVAMLLLLYAFLAVRKLRLNRRENKLTALLEAFGGSDSTLEHFLATGESSRRLQPRSRLQLEAFGTFLHRRMSNGGSQQETERISQLATRWLTDEYRLKLQGRHAKDRMNTLLLIGGFRLRELAADVRRLAKSDRSAAHERWMSLRVLALLHDESIWPMVQAEAARSELSEVSNHLLRHVLSAMNDNALEQVSTPFIWESLPPRLQENAVDVLRIRHLRSAECLRLFERLLTSPSSELRIRAFKALANFGYMSPEAEERFLQHIESAEMGGTERLMAARLMGDIPHQGYLPVLERWIGDSAYLVRFEAGAAMARYPDGIQRLHRISEQHPDRFARETAAELLERGDTGGRIE